MEKTSSGIKSQAGTLLAAVSLIGLSVGMMPAHAEGTDGNKGVLIGMSQQDKHTNQIKGQSDQTKGGAQPISLNFAKIEMDSKQVKGDGKQNTSVSEVPITKKNSQQVKGNSLQVKMHKSDLNPQPEPPG
jgi:hypothetical protein